jgi:hypothetical protein
MTVTIYPKSANKCLNVTFLDINGCKTFRTTLEIAFCLHTNSTPLNIRDSQINATEDLESRK